MIILIITPAHTHMNDKIVSVIISCPIPAIFITIDFLTNPKWFEFDELDRVSVNCIHKLLWMDVGGKGVLQKNIIIV
ncbi:hypothetical protein Hanom_Chr04g00383421 [Helianthus anomalus]